MTLSKWCRIHHSTRWEIFRPFYWIMLVQITVLSFISLSALWGFSSESLNFSTLIVWQNHNDARPISMMPLHLGKTSWAENANILAHILRHFTCYLFAFIFFCLDDVPVKFTKGSQIAVLELWNTYNKSEFYKGDISWYSYKHLINFRCSKAETWKLWMSNM